MTTGVDNRNVFRSDEKADFKSLCLECHFRSRARCEKVRLLEQRLMEGPTKSYKKDVDDKFCWYYANLLLYVEVMFVLSLEPHGVHDSGVQRDHQT